jgi:hypothetical protein
MFDEAERTRCPSSQETDGSGPVHSFADFARGLASAPDRGLRASRPGSSVEQLRAIAQVSPPLLDAFVAYLADGNQLAAERLARDPGWVFGCPKVAV